ncbi:transcriptional regulator GcvA [Salinisphaera sp. G21_0]|uniref:transcriptional regulator GcvA n=1 Tax=Salinisphaera sp. G21_0 TaxID=2821094 RepID=UPI001ADBE09A|nr:transcriptional regulator GcvA [Salinisphaera sp. G21_0]MBO9481854.1 transcriptional regulator GcvA [Salinisphaera sp. G21_0]
MKKRLPPLNWLRSFEASARLLSFTHAANELNLTQAAVSQQVKSLESQLGVALFKRLPRGLEMTEAGMAYLPAVHKAIISLSVATEELFGQGRDRLLTIRVNLVFFTTWLAPRMEYFREEFPEIGIRFTSNIWAENKDREADLEVRYGRGNWPDLKADCLTEDELFPVCSPELANGQPLPECPEQLSDHTLLHVIGYEEGWGYWFKQLDCEFRENSPSLQFDTLITALEMAKYGQGVALGRTSLVAGMLTSGELVAPLQQRVRASEGFYLTSPARQYLHPKAKVFRSWVLEESRKSKASSSKSQLSEDTKVADIAG